MESLRKWVLLHQKINKCVSTQQVDKNCFKRFPCYDVFVSYILGLFLTVQQRLEANDCENTSFVQLEPQMKVFNSVNLYFY